MLDRQRGAHFHDVVVRSPEGQVQEADRVEQRLRRVPERLDERLQRRLGSTRAVGVAAHAIDRDEHRRMFGDGGRHAVLVVVARSDEAEFGVIDAQAATFGVG